MSTRSIDKVKDVLEELTFIRHAFGNLEMDSRLVFKLESVPDDDGNGRKTVVKVTIKH